MTRTPARSNGFDALRLIAASLVIFGHAFPLTGRLGPTLLGAPLHAIGVKIFFVISGYLIAGSWRADPDLARFWARRGLRIFPGLTLVCAVAVFALGPALTTRPLAEYFSAAATRAYFWNLALYPIFDLPGVFAAGQPLTAVNGALWTLPVEVAMYAGLALLFGPAARLWRRAGLRPDFAALAAPAAAAVLLAGSLYVLKLSPPGPPLVIWGTPWSSALDIMPYFALGASVAALNIESFCRPLPAMALALAGALWLRHGPAREIVLALTLTMTVIGLGQRHFRALKPLDGHDWSYGVYLYGFPIQQSLIHFFGPQQAPALNVAAALPLALLCGALSWRLVERPALALKPSRPRNPASSLK